MSFLWLKKKNNLYEGLIFLYFHVATAITYLCYDLVILWHMAIVKPESFSQQNILYYR